LQRRQADMMMRIDEARQHDFPTRSDDRQAGVLAAQIIISADCGDDAIFLDQRAIGDFFAFCPGAAFGDHRAAAHKGSGHGGSFA